MSLAIRSMQQSPASSAAQQDDAIPLSELREHMSNKTFQWLEENEKPTITASDDDEQQDLLGLNNNNDDDEWTRVQDWYSSDTTADGFGGYVHSQDEPDTTTTSIRVQYILSPAVGGHGDDLWASSRHVANCFANTDACQKLLAPIFSGTAAEERKSTSPSHPLNGLTFLELGAGAGLPSWTALWCGASVVCTDQGIPDRVRCLAESGERNYRRMLHSRDAGEVPRHPRVCPYDWGTSTDEVLSLLDDEKQRFDVVVAADCIYMPEFHEKLLDSIQKLLNPHSGVALLPFALHGNTEDARVWQIVPLAEQKGFLVENLGAEQLTPQSLGMEAKRALVHMLRLTLSDE